jgi:arylsulfatase
MEKQVSMKCRIGIACAMLLAVRISASAASLDFPLEWQVSQRNAEEWAEVKVAGTVPTNATLVEVKAELGAGLRGKATEWTAVARGGQIKDGKFSGSLKLATGGWYSLKVRFRKSVADPAVVGEAVVEHVGVGDIFVVAGQSNSSNHGAEKQDTTTGLVAAFDGKHWQLANDPQPGASGNAGSFMPPFGDAMAGKFKVPVGIIACGIGATSVREWLPKGARFPNPPTLEGRVRQIPGGEWESKGEAFAMFTARMKQLGPKGFRAVLWHQGESDAEQPDPKRTLPGKLYRDYLEQLIKDSRREIGWDAPWFVALVSSHGGDGAPDIRAGQKSLWDDGLALEGPDSDALKGDLRDGVHFSGKGLREHGARWAEKISPWLEKQTGDSTSGKANLAGKRPNIIIILTDDQGFGDVSANGNPILKTPNLDRLHAEGVRLNDFHVSPSCSPTRSALMSGRHEFKNGVTHTIFERERMSLQTVTIAQVLKSAGYTTGIFGKWHLGDEDAYQPDRRGFDEVFIHGAGGIGQTYPGSCGDAPGNTYFNPAVKHNGKFEKTSGFCTDVFTAQALKWIESVKGTKPFFCYIPYNAPHGPLSCPPQFAKPYQGKVTPNEAIFFGMVANIDENAGRVLAKLQEWGIEKDTLVVFMNDNGGTGGCKVFNAGMRGGKCTAWEGGTRAASFWRWPGTLKPADVDKLTGHIDVFPTLAELAGAALDDKLKAQVEGRSLISLLENPQADWAERYLVTHVGRWGNGAKPQKFGNGAGQCSIRNSRYSLVHGKKDWELFDLKEDPGQENDVAAQHPDLVKESSSAYDQWWQEVLPHLENEEAYKTAPRVNPFKEQYRKQFGSNNK